MRLFILSSTENRCLYSESLFSKHSKYLLNTIQHMIQSRRLKVILVILGVVYDNTKDWIRINLHTDQVNYDNKSQAYTTTCVRTTSRKSINQGVEITDDQCHNIQQECILSNTVTENDIYDNCSYTSCINWEIEKTPETHSKKLEFNIDKPETSLKKIDFNIINNFDEIDDKNVNIMVHASNDLTNDMYNNIDHHNVDQKETNHNRLYTLADNELQLSLDLEDLDWNSTASHKGELIIAYDNNHLYLYLYKVHIYTHIQ